MRSKDIVSDHVKLIEMTNLPQSDTGVSGVIYISSMQGNHGPRIKWYPAQSKSFKDPCLSVSIDPNPQVWNLNLPKRVVFANQKYVRDWVRLNYTDLLKFWNNGYSWDRHQVNNFIDNLKRLTL